MSAYSSGTFYPPIKWKTMNMCACDNPAPVSGNLVYKRTRPCYCDSCYGDLSCQYASRQLPKWGLPSMIPTFEPAAMKEIPPLRLSRPVAYEKTINSKEIEDVKATSNNAVNNRAAALGQAEVIVEEGVVCPPCPGQVGILGRVLGTGQSRVRNEVLGALVLGSLVGYYYGNR